MNRVLASFFLFGLLLLHHSTWAVNVTKFGTHSKRFLIQEAAKNTQWVAYMQCSLLISEVMQIYQTIESSYALHQQLSSSESLNTAASIPCKLTLAAQSILNTLLIVNCDNSDEIHGKKLNDLLLSTDLGTIPQECHNQLLVVKDVVVKLRDDQYVNATVNQPVSGKWNLDRLDQRSLPRNNVYTYVRTGAGVTIYVVDTGCRCTHNDFTGRCTNIANFAGDGIDDTDCNGHGTHCASTAGGDQWGVAKDASIACIKALGCGGSGTFSAVQMALDEVLDRVLANPHSAVVSMSLAGGLYTPIHTQIATMVNTHKIAVVVAAGNSGDNACLYSPAAAPAAFTVGASTETDGFASFSNRGSCVDIAAPGTNIIAAGIGNDVDPATKSGTSMACPLVAGVVALELEQQLVDNPLLERGDGKLAQDHVRGNATISKIDSPSDSYDPLPLVFSSIGMPPVPQPPPPPPPPAPPQPNFANPNMPLGRPASTAHGLAFDLAQFLGNPLFLLFMAFLFVF
jgi:subtilisin family serine protease